MREPSTRFRSPEPLGAPDTNRHLDYHWDNRGFRSVHSDYSVPLHRPHGGRNGVRVFIRHGNGSAHSGIRSTNHQRVAVDHLIDIGLFIGLTCLIALLLGGLFGLIVGGVLGTVKVVKEIKR